MILAYGARHVFHSQESFFLTAVLSPKHTVRFMTLNRHLQSISNSLILQTPLLLICVRSQYLPLSFSLEVKESETGFSDIRFLSGCKPFSPDDFFYQWNLDSISSYSSAALPAFHRRDVYIIYQFSFFIPALQLLHYPLILVLST